MANVEAGSVYAFINAQAGNCLDLSGEDNKSIIGFDFHGGDNQKWRLEQEYNNWVIQNVGTGKYLGVEGLAGDGTAVVAIDDPFRWDIWPDEEDQLALRIFVPNTGLNIDLAGHGNSEPGTPITLWGKWQPGRNQLWYFKQD